MALKCSSGLNKGFSLLEVLIAVLVIAFGLLGMAALQLKTVQNSHSAYQRTVASIIAMDAVERLWISIGTNEDLSDVTNNWRTNWIPSDSHSPKILPSNQSDLVIDACPARRCTITVSWVDGRLNEATAPKSSFVYSIDLY